jgi:amino acid transporter
MPGWVERIQRIGWVAVEASLLIIVLCVLLDIIVGPIGLGFISLVASNAKNFLQTIPPGTILGLVIIIFLYWFIRSRT